MRILSQQEEAAQERIDPDRTAAATAPRTRKRGKHQY